MYIEVTCANLNVNISVGGRKQDLRLTQWNAHNNLRTSGYIALEEGAVEENRCFIQWGIYLYQSWVSERERSLHRLFIVIEFLSHHFRILIYSIYVIVKVQEMLEFRN